jgi:hypothetical protein
MVEKVALAICGALPWECPPGVPACEDCMTQARAAIKAMRMPTPKMLRAAGKAMSPEKRPTKKRVGAKAKHGIRYRAMIDAALKGDE